MLQTDHLSSVPPYDEMWAIASDISDHKGAVDEFLPCLLDGLEHTPPTASVLEIGVWAGGSAIFTLWHLLQEGQGRRLITVDHGGEQDDRPLYDYARQHGCNWVHNIYDQHVWVKQLPLLGYRFGFVYHDGQHGDASVVPDVLAIAPFIVPGGTLAVDDAHECVSGLSFAHLGLETVTDYYPPHRGCGGINFYRKVPPN